MKTYTNRVYIFPGPPREGLAARVPVDVYLRSELAGLPADIRDALDERPVSLETYLILLQLKKLLARIG